MLERFNKELGEVNVTSVSFSSATIAFDIFFDNIFTDFSVQSQINDALRDTKTLMARVKEIMNKLGKEKRGLGIIIFSKRKEYDDFIEKI